MRKYAESGRVRRIDHAGGFDQTERDVDGEEFAGGAGGETIGIIHTKPIRAPIERVARELGQLIVRHPVIAVNGKDFCS